jgi:hypothetical protein
VEFAAENPAALRQLAMTEEIAGKIQNKQIITKMKPTTNIKPTVDFLLIFPPPR